MYRPTINVVDEHSGQAVPVPDEVLGVVSRANEILEKQLQPLEHIYLNGEWCQFEQSDDGTWRVSLRVFTPDYSFLRQVRVEELRTPAVAKEFIMEAFWDFGQTLSAKVGEMIRQVRSDLKKMLAG